MFRHRVLPLLLGLLAACLAPLATSGPASAEPEITQNARLRQIKYFTGYYSRANPGADDPSYPLSENTVLSRATGKISGKITTYKLGEDNRDWDFYFVDVDYAISDRKGDEDWGWMDVLVTSAGDIRVFYPRYSKGIGAVNHDDCRKYDLGISAGLLGISAGTTIASFKTCAEGSSIGSWSYDRGRRYKVNKLNGVYQVNMRRFVQVRAGKLPKFRVTTQWNKDSGRTHCGWYSNGSTMVYECWADRKEETRSYTIGTQR